MEIKKILVVKEFINSLKIIKKKKIYLIYPSLSDIFFLVFYGFILAGITGYVYAIGSFVSQNSGAVLRSYAKSQNLIQFIINQPQIRHYVNRILLLIFVVYLIYCFFQGISWKLSSDMRGKRIKFLAYMKQFYTLNISWFLIFMVYNVFSFLTELGRTVMQRINPSGAVSSSIIPTAILIGIFYFTLISYTLIGKYGILKVLAKTFVIGVKKVRYILPMYLIIFLVFSILNLIMFLTFKIHENLMIVTGILLVIPAVTWARVFISVVIDRIEKDTFK
jgi:hypothetical protein